jgi:hypothetical protein
MLSRILYDLTLTRYLWIREGRGGICGGLEIVYCGSVEDEVEVEVEDEEDMIGGVS